MVVKLGCWSLSHLTQALSVRLHMARVADPPASGGSLVSVLIFPLDLQVHVLLCLGVCGSGVQTQVLMLYSKHFTH